MLLRHGSSLVLMALARAALNDSDEFGEVDPRTTGRNGPSGRTPEAQFVTTARRAAAAADAVAQHPAGGPRPVHTIEGVRVGTASLTHVTTRKAFRGKGFLQRSLSSSRRPRPSEEDRATLALEECAHLLMGKGFILEPSKQPQQQLNVFPDSAPAPARGGSSDEGEARRRSVPRARRQLEEEGSDSGEDDEDEGEALVGPARSRAIRTRARAPPRAPAQGRQQPRATARPRQIRAPRARRPR